MFVSTGLYEINVKLYQYWSQILLYYIMVHLMSDPVHFSAAGSEQQVLIACTMYNVGTSLMYACILYVNFILRIYTINILGFKLIICSLKEYF